MVKRIHRVLALICAIFWIVQAATGILIVFRWEFDDATVSGAAAPIDPTALGKRIEALAAGGSNVSSMWASGGRADRFDIFHEQGGIGHVTRVDGAGTILRERGAHRFAEGGFWDTLTRIHQSLLSGDTGAWIVGISGIVLLTNLLLGLRIAWPRRALARMLSRRPTGSPTARTYGWHRLLGLWLGIPATAMVAAGIMLVFVGGVERSLGAALPADEASGAAPAAGRISPEAALRRALAQHPGARISGLEMPGEEAVHYSIRLNVPGETSRIYGATTVNVSASDGQVLLDHDARESPWNRWVVETLYPFHTGQYAGLAGRLLALAIGAWLLTMIVLGLRLWWLRRRPRG